MFCFFAKTVRASALAALEEPDWPQLVQQWPDGRLKLAWTRQLLKLRTELAELFTEGDYQPLDVSGPHRAQVIAFARRHGRDAAIIAVAKSFAPFTQGGRAWLIGEAFDGALNIKGYETEAGEDELQLSLLFRHLPVAVLKAKPTGTRKPAGKGARPASLP
jgi:(1->4)-alpha-D-glucan 1-alpha-D-glucosylmutase